MCTPQCSAFCRFIASFIHGFSVSWPFSIPPQAKIKYQKQMAEMFRVLNEAEAAKPQTAGVM
jgi:hypothetical protein